MEEAALLFNGFQLELHAVERQAGARHRESNAHEEQPRVPQLAPVDAAGSDERSELPLADRVAGS